MDTFDSSNHRNTWANYPPECYSTSIDYYRPYGTARKCPAVDDALLFVMPDAFSRLALPWMDSNKYSVGNWSSQAASSSFPYSSTQPPHAHTNFLSTTNPSSANSFGQPYYPPTPPKDLSHDALLDSSNKQQQQQQHQQQHQQHHLTSAANAAAAAAYPHHHNWGHVLKDPSLFWSTMKSSPDSPSKTSNSSLKKKPSQGTDAPAPSLTAYHRSFCSPLLTSRRSRMRQLRSESDSSMATRWQRQLPMQRLRTVS